MALAAHGVRDHTGAWHRGDLIIVSDQPFSPLFVIEMEDERRIHALDPITGRRVTYAPTLNLFVDFVVQVVSLFDVLDHAGRST